MAAVHEVKVDETADRSSDEKYVHAVFDPAAVHDMPPDPDENLSAEEKAHIVGFYLLRALSTCISNGHSQDRKLLWKLDCALIPWVSI